MSHKTKRKSLHACPPKPPIQNRPLLSAEQAGDIERLFKILGNQTRSRLLHALIRAGELSVTKLAEVIDMKPQAVSNQLQRLMDRGIVGARRNGNNVFYRVVDPCVAALLDQGMCLAEDAKSRVER